MKIKPGDQVKFLNSVGGGKVVSIDKDVAYVKDHDDFEIPVKVTELLKDETADFYGKSQRAEENGKEEKAQEPEEVAAEAEESPETYDYQEKEDDTLNIYLGFVPEDESRPTEANIQVYLINDSNYFLLYNFALPQGENFVSRNSGKLEPNTKFKIQTLERESLNDLKTIVMQIIPFKMKAYNLQQPIDKVFKIQPVKFFKLNSFKENDFFEEKSVIYTIMDEFSEKLNKLSDEEMKTVIEEKEVESRKLNTPKQYKKPEQPEQEEVDLHIHELLDDERGLSNKEMLELQLDYFRKKMQEALKSNLHRIVFIHGVGNGTLKLELRKELERNYSHIRYQDASFAEYGYGATMVYLK